MDPKALKLLRGQHYQMHGGELYRTCDGCLSYEKLERLHNWNGPLYCPACMKKEERREERSEQEQR